MQRQVRGAGVLVPEELRWVAAESEGRVERVLVQPGAEVGAETIVIELVNLELEYAARQAELDFRAEEAALRDLPARLELERLGDESALVELADRCRRLGVTAGADRALDEHGAVPALARRESEAEATTCGTRLDLARRRLDRLRQSESTRLAAQRARAESLRGVAELRRRQVEALVVKAGRAGVLQDVAVEVGQRVAPGTTLAKVAPPDRLKAVLKVSEGEARDLAPGLRAMVDYRTGKVAGKVARVEPAVRGGTVTVEVTLENSQPPGARSDLSVDALIDFERIDDALVVGRPAASDGGGAPGQRLSLFRIDADGNTATRTEVALGRASSLLVEITGGLAPGDRVIVSDMTGWQSVRQIRLR